MASRGRWLALAGVGVIAGCGGGAGRVSTSSSTPQPNPSRYISLTFYNLATHRTDIKVAASSETLRGGTAGGEVEALPCSKSKYLVTAIGGSLAGPEGTPYKATLTFGNVTLPRGIACGGPLPVTLGPSHLVIKITEGHVLKFKISGRRRASGALDGILFENISTSLCNGRFLFRATLEGSFGVRVFSYPFLLSRVTGVVKGCH